jgi:ATP-dependent DNA ligase
LWLDGEDLRKLPLIERKQHLHALIKKSRLAEIIYAQHIETQGEALFEEICHRDLEGVVAKCKRGAYRDDGKDWLKIKNPNYSQAEGRHEMLRGKRQRLSRANWLGVWGVSAATPAGPHSIESYTGPAILRLEYPLGS